MKLLNFINALTERAAQPGLLGFTGRVLERRFTREVKAYFEHLAVDIKKLELENLAGPDAQAEEIVRHAVEMKIANALRRHSTSLREVLENNLADGYRAAIKMDYAQEAKAGLSKKDAQQKGLDLLGPSGEKAAKWASDSAAKLVTGINKTTQQDIADAIMQGIEERLGVPGTGRLIRDLMKDASRSRAEMIASTEMNRAMSTAALDKMNGLGIEYKQIILSEDACPICEDNADEDPLPVDDEYPSGDLVPPFHPNCRCAITGARPPSDDEEN